MTNSPTPTEAYDPNLYLVHFAQIHETFRKAELNSLATLHKIPLKWVEYSDSVHSRVISPALLLNL
jgi:tRNA G10  N-methylase Trm11